MHTIKETDMIVAKPDLLLKQLNERAEFKKHRKNYAQAMNSHSGCEICGNDGHSWNDYPRLMKTHPTSSLSSSTTITGFVHIKEARGGTNRVHHSTEVTILIPISIRTNLPCETLF